MLDVIEVTWALSEGRQRLSAAREPARRISGPPRGLPHLVVVRAPVHDAVGGAEHQHQVDSNPANSLLILQCC